MPLPRRTGIRRPAAQEPADGTAECTDGEYGGERVLLHGPAQGFRALSVITLGLRHIAPALLEVALTTLIEIVGEARPLVVAGPPFQPLAGRSRWSIQVVGHTFR